MTAPPASRRVTIARLAAAVLAAAVIGGCTSPPAAEPVPPPPELLDSSLDGAELPVPISYEWRRSQLAMAPEFKFIANAFGLYLGPGNPPVAGPTPLDWSKDRQRLVWHGAQWHPDRQEYTFGAELLAVEFLDPHWDPANSGSSYGAADTLSSGTITLPDLALDFDACQSEAPEKISQSRAVSLATQRSTATSSSFEVDVGSKTGVTIGGDDVGAKLEEELQVALGWKSGVEEAKSRTASTTETVTIDSQIDPGHRGTLTIDADELHTSTPVHYWGAWTAGVRITTRGPLGDPGGPFSALWRAWEASTTPDSDDARTMTWDTWDDLVETLSGTNTETPHFDEAATAVIRPQAQRLWDPSARWVTITATETRTYGDAARYRLATQPC